MVNKTVNIDLNVSDKGSIDAATAEAKKLNKELSEAEKTASKINAPRKSQAAENAKRQALTPRELVEYNSGRLAGGPGGTSARDFAAQAQGLGGLVRLYATFAANIYAVTTAFNALKEAANVDKMIEASNKFSAVTGNNMNSIAKSLQKATDYTLAFQDAIKFTNIGTAAGLSGKEIENLTVIAKGAANALGRDVGESIQRIIQGTAKQEQEILDELGIFVKSKKAFEEYAKARNIKVDDLTARQRTLAYAEAVAKAGEQWKEFATIEDPYAKLVASGKEAVQETLSSINKIVTPIVKLFADNADAIKALLTLVTVTLVKKALPELKNALTDAFSFKKIVDKQKIQDSKEILVKEYTDLNAKLLRLKQERDKLASLDTSSEANIRGLSSRVDPGAIQRGRGDYGLSLKRLTTSIYGTDQNPVDIRNYKAVEDVQNRISASIKAQLADERTRDAVLKGMVAKKVLEEGSTAKNLILTESTKKIAQEEYEVIQRKIAALGKQAALEKEIKTTQLGVGRAEKSLKQSGILPSDVKALSADFMGPPTRSMLAFSEATKTSAKSMDAFMKGIVANKEAMHVYNVAADNAGTGISAWAAGLKNFGVYLGSFTGQIAAATTGLSGFAKVAASTGAVASYLGGALSLVARGFMAALGPLTLLWTAWEIFGDTIKGWLGISKEVNEQIKATEESLKSYYETLKSTTEAQERANKVLQGSPESYAEIRKALETQSNALKSEVDAYRKYVEEKNKIQAEEKKSVVAKEYGKERAELFANAEAQQKAAEQKRFFTSMTIEQAVAQGQLVDKLVASRKALELVNTDKTRKEFKDATENLMAFNATLAEQERFAREKSAASVGKLENAYSSLNKVFEDIDPQKLKAVNMGLDPKAVQAYESISKLPKLSEYTKGSPEYIAGLKEASTSMTTLVKNTKDLKTASLELAKARELNTRLLALESQLATATSIRQAESISSAIEAVQVEMNQLLQGSPMAFAKVVDSAEKAAKNAVSELSKAAKAELAKIRLEIDSLENSIKGLMSSIKTQDKISDLTAAISGRIVGPNTKQLDILAEEEKLAERKAYLQMREVELRNKGNKELEAEAKKVYNATKLQAEITRQQETTSFRISQLEKESAEAVRLATEARNRENAILEDSFNIRKAEADLIAERTANQMKAIGFTSEEVNLYQSLAEQQSLLLAQDQARAKLAQERQAELASAGAKADLAKEAVRIKYDGSDRKLAAEELLKVEAEYQAQVSKVNSEFGRRMSTAETLNALALERNSMQVEMNSLLAVQSREMSKVAKLSGSLEKAFEGTGLEKQAKALSSLVKASTTSKQKIAKLDKDEQERQLKYSKTKEKLENELMGGVLTNRKVLDDLNENSAMMEKRYAEERKQAEFEATIATIEGFKSMMSEKTAGYRILDGIEKAMHTYKMVMQAKELASDIAATAKFVANGIAKSSANATAAITNQGSGDPYTAFARIAAMIALMAAVTGKSQGGGASIPAGVTAKDRQETQGTGMSWVDGKKVETGGGVFGDAEAKSESIKNSLEIIKENSIEGLSFDNKMLKALESIDRAITGVSTSLYRIPGIRTGSAFGTIEGTQKGSSFLQNFVSQIFGNKSVSQEILDSGVKLSGSFKELAKGTQGLINFYETVQTTTTKSRLFGLSKSTSTSIETSTKGAPAEITQAVSSIFSYANQLFIDVGARIGKTAEDIDTALSSINFDQLVSLRDLKGEDLEKEFNAVISSMLDSTADTLFAEMKRFQKFGEGMLETVVRVVDTNKKLNDGLNAIAQSSALKAAGKALDYDITEKLIEAVGGLETFTEQIEYFRDEFLTEAERIAPVAKTVKEEMTRLGYGLVDTKAEFKTLVQSLDLTIPAQRELYASLMAVARSFAEVYKETEKMLEADEYRNKLIEMETEGLRLLGLETLAIASERNKELEELNKLVPAQRDQLVYYQKVLWAIEDELAIRNEEVELLGMLGFSYDQLVLQREMELMGLTEQVRAVKKWQFAVEDYNNSQGLMIELLGKVGDGSRATALIRERELKGLNATDKAIKRAIYALEDEQAIRDKIVETKEKETSALEDNISATRDYIKSLKDYRSSLLGGNLSPLNPLQKYEQTKAEALALAAKASAPASTEAEKRAQKEARDKLQSSTNAWLEASRVLFASSTAYTSDFNTVLDIVNKAIGAAEGSLSDAEQQLAVLKQSETMLNSIQENTKTTAELMAELSAAQVKTAEALANVPEDLASIYKVDELYAYIATLPQAIQALPDALTKAINSVVPLGGAYLPGVPGLPGAGYVGPLPPAGYVGPNIPVLTEPDAGDAALVEITGYTVEGNELTRQLIAEVNALRTEVANMKSEARSNTDAIINAEFRAGQVTGEVVANGVVGAVNNLNWQQSNTVVLR